PHAGVRAPMVTLNLRATRRWGRGGARPRGYIPAAAVGVASTRWRSSASSMIRSISAASMVSTSTRRPARARSTCSRSRRTCLASMKALSTRWWISWSISLATCSEKLRCSPRSRPRKTSSCLVPKATGPSLSRMAHLVEGDGLLLLLGDHPALALRAGDDPGDRLLEVVHADQLAVVARRQDGGLVDEVGEVGAREAGGLLGEHLEQHGRVQRLVARVHLEDGAAAADVGAVEGDVAVEAPRPEQRGVEHVRPVGGRDDDDVGVGLEAVHLDEQLVEGLLALVVAAAETGTALAADGVDLVHEDDAGAVLLGLVEEVADAARADADEHLHELGAADAEEGDARL